MERKIDLKEITDGRLYSLNDMVKAECRGCEGCSACCRGMGDSIKLDPMDVYRLTTGLSMSFQELMGKHVELHVVDGIILPNLRMTEGDERCTFLDAGGRCSVHSLRPGFCRLFPLGRLYENRSFRYFLQVNECARENRTKVKVQKWIDTPEPKKYDEFICDWHYCLKDLEQGIRQQPQNQTLAKAVSMYILNQFYVKPYEKEDFYSQFYGRLSECKRAAAQWGIKEVSGWN